jgi:phage N-6-adenine-methyltransferase
MVKVYHSTGKDDWATPRNLVEYLITHGTIPRFDLDVCADKHNFLGKAYINEKMDALKTEWSTAKKGCWMNPPYSKNTAFICRAYEQSMRYHMHVSCLVPARTDTKWWYEWVADRAYAVYFIKGRLRFVGAESSAPFPSAIICYGGINPNLTRHDYLDIPSQFRRD